MSKLKQNQNLRYNLYNYQINLNYYHISLEKHYKLVLFIIIGMFFEQSKNRTQEFIIRSLEGQMKAKSKHRFLQERSQTGNHSPYKKRISFNLFSKNKASRTQQIQHRESIKPIMFEMQFDEFHVHPIKIADKNIYLRSEHVNNVQILIKPKYSPLLKCNQMKLNPYNQTIGNSTIKSSHSTSNSPYTVAPDHNINKTMDNDSAIKAKVHRSLVFNNTDSTLKLYISGGNNHHLVERVMMRRQRFSITSQANSMVNFKWTQTSDKIKFNNINSSTGFKQIVNHFQFHDQITTKSGLLRNLKIKCEKQQRDQLFDITPITFEIDFNNSDKCEEQIKRFIHFYIQNHPLRRATLRNKRKQQDYKHYLQFIKKLKPIYTIQNYTYHNKQNPFSKPVMKDVYSGTQNSYLWLLKPTSLNRGRGIYIFESVDELISILQEYFLKNNSVQDKTSKKMRESSLTIKNDAEYSHIPKLDKYIKSSSFVIQKYIEKPLLVNKRKFDIRVWVLVTHNFELFFFKQGYIRTSCKQFQIQKKDLFVHLTNNAIQKNSQEYGIFQQGNQLSFENMQNIFIQSQQSLVDDPSYKQISFIGDLVPEMKRLIQFSMESVKKKINANNRKHSFELFGYDFMIDVNYKLLLIEVNTNPCIQQSSPLLKTLLPRMLDDAMQLTIDQVFKIRKCASLYPVKDYSNEQNMWQYLCDLKEHQQLKK